VIKTIAAFLDFRCRVRKFRRLPFNQDITARKRHRLPSVLRVSEVDWICSLICIRNYAVHASLTAVDASRGMPPMTLRLPLPHLEALRALLGHSGR
jgi:hypothetical protein